MRFDGKVIVLTGVGREGQVGEAVARAFADAGAKLVLTDRLIGGVEARALALRALGANVSARACDLTDEAQVRALATDVGALHGGRVDALVHLAGGFAMSGPVADSASSVWQRQLAINLTTAYLATRAFLPLLRAARGSIVYFAAASALPGGQSAGMSGYVAAKSGVLALMHAVAEEERDTGVRANAVAPTNIRTVANLHAMGDAVRYVEREEVAGVVGFLCSDDARAVTGQTIALE